MYQWRVEILRIIMGNLSQDSQCPSQDSSRASHKSKHYCLSLLDQCGLLLLSIRWAGLTYCRHQVAMTATLLMWRSSNVTSGPWPVKDHGQNNLFLPFFYLFCIFICFLAIPFIDFPSLLFVRPVVILPVLFLSPSGQKRPFGSVLRFLCSSSLSFSLLSLVQLTISAPPYSNKNVKVPP
jgi:hypothetical protein